MPRPVNLKRQQVKSIVNQYRNGPNPDVRLDVLITDLERYEGEMDTDLAAIQALENDLVTYEQTKRAEIQAATEERELKKGGIAYIEDKIVDIHYELADAPA